MSAVDRGAGERDGGSRRRSTFGYVVTPSILYGNADPNKWATLDVYSGFRRRHSKEHVKPYLPRSLVESTPKPKGPCALLWRTLQAPVLLALVGVLSALVSISISYMIKVDFQVRNLWLQNLNGTWQPLLGYAAASSVLAALACAATHAICPEAAGSGVPEMRVVLSGALKPVLLQPRMLVAKACGLVLSLLAGLSVGKEGPFIHIACVVADMCLKFKPFKRVADRDSKRLDILMCACAAGVAATFGTPFGGVLFSIEVVTNAYFTKNLARAAFCATSGAIVYAIFGVEDSMALFSDNDAAFEGLPASDLLLFALVGVLSGAFGALFTTAVEWLTAQKLKFLNPSGRGLTSLESLGRKLLITVLGAMLVAAPTYYDITLGIYGESRTITDSLFRDETLGLHWSLLLFPVFKVFVTLVSVVLPLPVGLFTPVFITGAAFGRILGEACALLSHAPHSSGATTKFEPWEFAVVGAAAFSTGVTRAISVAVIVFELSDEGHLRLPVAIAVVLAYFVGQRFSPNVYDALADTTGTPYLPKLPSKLKEVPVHKISRRLKAPDVLCLEASTYETARTLLRVNPNDEAFAVVRSKESMHLVGRVLRVELAAALQDFETKHFLSEAPMPSLFRRSGNSGGGAYQNTDYKSAEEARDVGFTARTESVQDLFETRMQFIVEHDGRLLEYTENTYLLSATTDLRSRTGSLGERFSPSPLPSPRNPNDTRDEEAGSPMPGRFQPPVITDPVDVVTIRLDPYPYQMVATMPLMKADTAFRLLRLGTSFVTHKGRLWGVLTRDDLREFIGDNARRPLDRIYQLLDAFCACTRRGGYDVIPEGG